MLASVLTRDQPADIDGERMGQGDSNVDGELRAGDAALEPGEIAARESGTALDFLLAESKGNTQALDPAGDLLPELHAASLATTRPEGKWEFLAGDIDAAEYSRSAHDLEDGDDQGGDRSHRDKFAGVG